MITLCTAAFFAGCSTPQADISGIDEPLHLRFPVILHAMDGDEAQLELEEKIISRVSMQSAYPRCGEAPQGACVLLTVERSEKPLAISGLQAHYYDANRTEGTVARYTVEQEKTQSGRAFYVTLMAKGTPRGGSQETQEDAAQLDGPRPARFCK